MDTDKYPLLLGDPFRTVAYLEPAKEFWPVVYAPEDPVACWHWTGSRTPFGHGTIWGIKAHRFAWAVANQMLPHPHLVICHECDFPPCVRPSHLTIGTRKDNAMDTAKRGRRRVHILKQDPRAFGVCCRCKETVPYPIPVGERLIGVSCGCFSTARRVKSPPKNPPVWDISAPAKPFLEMAIRATPAAIEFLSSHQHLAFMLNPFLPSPEKTMTIAEYRIFTAIDRLEATDDEKAALRFTDWGGFEEEIAADADKAARERLAVLRDEEIENDFHSRQAEQIRQSTERVEARA